MKLSWKASLGFQLFCRCLPLCFLFAFVFDRIAFAFHLLDKTVATCVVPSPPPPGRWLHFYRAEGSAFPLTVGFCNSDRLGNFSE